MSIKLSFAVTGLAVLLAACGGGTGGDGEPEGPTAGGGAVNGGVVSTGNLIVTVTDPTGQPASNVRVVVYALDNGGNFQAVTGPGGMAELQVPEGRLGVFAVAPEFAGGQPEVSLGKGQTLKVSISMRPRTERPAGGIADASVEAVSADGRILELWLGYFPVNGDNGDEFAHWAKRSRIEDCVPDAANDAPGVQADCIAGPAGFDATYTGAVASTIPEPWLSTPSAVASPFEALLLLDQGTALAAADPADRRLFAAKYFLSLAGGASGGQKRVALGAFAADDAHSGRYSALPQKPLSLFPLENPGLTSDGRSFFPIVDALATQEGGAGALLSAVDKALDFLGAVAWPGRRGIVVVSSGTDDICGSQIDCLQRRDAVIAKSRALGGVRIVTIGLAGAGTAAQHESMNLLAQSNWGGAALWLDEPSQFAAAMADAHSILSERKPYEYAYFRIESPTPGAFVSGRTVLGKVRFVDCPWDCYDIVVPFAVKIP